MPTQLQIANHALRLIHQTKITDINSTTDASAIVIQDEWDDALLEFLTEAHWNWAKERVVLTAASPAPSFGWANRFAVPDDFVSVHGINEVYADTPSELWELESGYIHTDDSSPSDAPTINLEYIRKPDASGLETFLAGMDPKAVNALVVLLASKIAPQLAKDGLNTASALLQRYYGVDLPKARFRNELMNRRKPRFPYQTSTVLGQRRSFSNT